MCWYLKFEITPERPTEHVKSQIEASLKKYVEFKFDGIPLKYLVIPRQTSCGLSCGLVREKGNSLNVATIDLLEDIVLNESVKNVKIWWYWLKEPNKVLTEDGLTSFFDFKKMNENEVLLESKVYKINDPKKYI
jgi:hypothetical protein